MNAPIPMTAEDMAGARETAFEADLEWTVVLPFHNERDHLAPTLASLAEQNRAYTLILVDNGSTDGSGAVASAACETLGLDFILIDEPRPGKVAALDAGTRRARTRFIATCDADTYYPPDYLAHAQRLLENGGVFAGARFRPRSASLVRRWMVALHLFIAALILPGQCFSGGAGQAFRTDGLMAVGGFDQAQWDFVLEDHEICHRLGDEGALLYAADFWCDPGSRERKRPATRWTLSERLLYHLLARHAGDWFFYRFLAGRLAGRGLTSARLRVDPDSGAPT